jgi:hypothetical protein
MAGNPVVSGRLYEEWKACGLEELNDVDTFRVELYELQERVRRYNLDGDDGSD